MPDSPMVFDLNALLRFAITQGVSDIHLKPGRPPIFRRSATMDLVAPRGLPVLEKAEIEKIVDSAMEDRHRATFAERGEVDFGWGVEALGRVRINLHRSRFGLQAVMRVITAIIPTLQQLGLPKVVEQIASERRGLVLVTGAAGQGKSTTLAAIADHINRARSCHIVTIEDPIEYLIEDRRSVVTQREVGQDTDSFHSGLRSALRQDPDVIIVGEMRDRETIETALLASETGHLVLSTMHTIDARETVNRVVSVFAENEQTHARAMMSSVLRAVISQRLVPRADGRGRVPSAEIMIGTPRVRELLGSEEGPDELPIAISQGHSQYGMQTFDQSISALYREGRVNYEEALKQCSNPADFALRAKGISSSTGEPSDTFDIGKVDRDF